MTISKTWAGRIFGTNTGNVLVKFKGPDSELTGEIRLNDDVLGISIYEIKGTFAGGYLKLIGSPAQIPEGYEAGDLSVEGELTDRGNLEGEWKTTIGSAGGFTLFSHDQRSQLSTDQPEQFYTTRFNFGAIEVDKDRVIKLADEIQKDFGKGRVFITTTTETEQTQYLDDFRKTSFESDRAIFIKLFAQEPDNRGLNKTVSIEFGPHLNTAMVQGADESWTLGKLERIKRIIKHYERNYAITFVKRYGIGINQVLLLAAIVFLPSIDGFGRRLVFLTSVILSILVVQKLHEKFFPHAAVHLQKTPNQFVSRFLLPFGSWVIAILGMLIAALSASLLQGWLPILTN